MSHQVIFRLPAVLLSVFLLVSCGGESTDNVSSGNIGAGNNVTDNSGTTTTTTTTTDNGGDTDTNTGTNTTDNSGGGTTEPGSSGGETGSALLSWTPPTTNSDGSTLTDLAGYKIYYGTSSGSYSQVQTTGPGLSSFVVENLASGTWYFAVSAFDTNGNEGVKSNEASKSI